MRKILIHIVSDLFLLWPLLYLMVFSEGKVQELAENGVIFMGILYWVTGICGVLTYERTARTRISEGEAPRPPWFLKYVYATSAIEAWVLAMHGLFWTALGWLVALLYVVLVNEEHNKQWGNRNDPTKHSI